MSRKKKSREEGKGYKVFEIQFLILRESIKLQCVEEKGVNSTTFTVTICTMECMGRSWFDEG